MVDAFLLIGQSNMAGRGTLGELPPIHNPKVLMLRDHAWQIAVDPVHQDKGFAGEGLGLRFGDVLAQRFDRTIGLIPCAVGGTSLAQWHPNEALFNNAVTCTREALSLGASLRGILWHQGEAESGTLDNAQSYAARFLVVFNALHDQLGIRPGSVPVVVGELGRFLYMRDKSPYASVVNEQLHVLEAGQPHIACISSEALVDKGDQLHFDARSVRVMGERYAQAWLALAEQLGIKP